MVPFARGHFSFRCLISIPKSSTKSSADVYTIIFNKNVLRLNGYWKRRRFAERKTGLRSGLGDGPMVTVVTVFGKCITITLFREQQEVGQLRRNSRSVATRRVVMVYDVDGTEPE